jgi:hypothetical protein
MVLMASREQAAARRQKYVTPGGATTFVSTYLGTNKMELLAQGTTQEEAAAAAAGQPMAYLVEQAPGDTVDPHYHQVDQFQLFVGGSGHIGTHPLEGVTVHYAAPHSPYGPIVAGADGVQYVTLRRNWDPGAQWMPGAAPALRNMPGRKHATFTSPPLERCADLCSLQGTSSTEVMPGKEGGPGAWIVRAGPNGVLRADPPAGQGRFWYVLAGSLLAQGQEYGSGACFFLPGDEPPFECRAGAGGVELVQVQFPGA